MAGYLVFQAEGTDSKYKDPEVTKGVARLQQSDRKSGGICDERLPVLLFCPTIRL